MTSVYVVEKLTVPGKQNRPITTRYHVRVEYGRGEIHHLGVYPTPESAQERVNGARAQLARGEMPARRPVAPPPPKPKTTVKALAAEWLATRIDVADNTLATFRSSIAAIEEEWETADPEALTVADIQVWVMESTCAVGTLGLRVSHLAQILDYGDVEPNPARSSKLKLPRKPKKVYRLPTSAELVLLYAALDERYHGPVKFMEASGVRVSGTLAITWGDWDRPRERVLVTEKTAAGKRWIDQIGGLPVMPDRPDGVRDDTRVWAQLSVQAVQAAMRKACVAAGIRNYSPHDLRHLHLSRLLRDGMDPVSVAARAGHASPKITLDLYAHVVPPD